MRKRFSFLLCLFIPALLGAGKVSDQAPKYRVLVGCPVRQTPEIFKEFLWSLSNLNQNTYTTDYYFIDDNDNEETSKLLKEFSDQTGTKCEIFHPSSTENNAYICNEEGHQWTHSLMWKVGRFKDRIIQYALDNAYDYLFFVDSDIVLHPITIEHLISTKKDIISNIFWTCWAQDSIFLPQVWMYDQYTQYEILDGEQLSQEEIHRRHLAFLMKMRTPGTHEVGGLGACTLISKKALEQGVNFKKVKNCSFWGEDRHFCLRAAAMGLDLFVDTHYPAYHIFRESALSDVERYKQSCISSKQKQKSTSQRITLSMIMKNESGHRLRECLENASRYITDAIIIDDASTDNSVEICEEVLAKIPHRIIKNDASKFHNEIELRGQQWEETIKMDPEWILFLDADEIFEDKFAENVQDLIASSSVDVYYFRLYDFWNENHYRQDKYWNAHQIHRPFLIRYRSDIPHVWHNQNAQHCGRMPSSCTKLIGTYSEYRVKHFGWENSKIRKEKYQRYAKLDPEAKYGIKEQYESILDSNPILVKWEE